jgi:5'-nucleotidase
VAAVREAVSHGVPGIAVSHYIRRGLALDWDRAARLMGPVLRRLLAEPWLPGTYWNVNLPHLEADAPDPDVVFCPLDISPLPVMYRQAEGGLLYCGNYHQRARRPGGDVEVCFGGKIAVSRLTLG